MLHDLYLNLGMLFCLMFFLLTIDLDSYKCIDKLSSDMIRNTQDESIPTFSMELTSLQIVILRFYFLIGNLVSGEAAVPSVVTHGSAIGHIFLRFTVNYCLMVTQKSELKR